LSDAAEPGPDLVCRRVWPRMKLVSWAFAAWRGVIWAIMPLAWLVVFFASRLLFPQERTREPHPIAIAVWVAVNTGFFVLGSTQPSPVLGGILAAIHFLIIVTALLVISEDTDVLSGYVHRKQRWLDRGEVIRSLPVILISAVCYLAFLAVAVKGMHAESRILNVRYSSAVSIWSYLATVLVQIPVFESSLKSLAQIPVFQGGLKTVGFKGFMEFRGVAGLSIKYAINLSYVSIIVGAVNSYFRQKSQIRRLIEAISSEKGDWAALEAQATRAPEEIKTGIINLSLHDPSARVRATAMRIATKANSIRFPNTIIYHLHEEPVEQNKHRALGCCDEIITRNRDRLQPDFFRELRSTIDHQLNRRRRDHDPKTLSMLAELRSRLNG
jgi:hypothetical protein